MGTLKLTIHCTAWKPLHRNTLRGFATLRLPELRLTIHDVAIHQHENGARWATLPSKPILDRDGVAKRDPSTGKISYVPMLEFEAREVRDAFSAAVVRAVLEFNPHAFDVELVS